MKTWKHFWITLMIGAILGMTMALLVRELLTRKHQATIRLMEADFALKDREHQARADSIMKAFDFKTLLNDSLALRLQEQKNLNQSLDVKNEQLEKAYNQIAEKVKKLLPHEILNQIDSLTESQNYPKTAFLDSMPGIPGKNYALAAMPRMEKILLQLIERGSLLERVNRLNQTIIERDGTILTLHSIILNYEDQIKTLFVLLEEKNGQILIRNSWIETLKTENATLKKTLTKTYIGTGITILILTAAILKN